jgi:hypothetical protein
VIALAERTIEVVKGPPALDDNVHTEASELLCEQGYPGATIIMVRSAGDTFSKYEEIWFLDQYDRKILATLVPQERKHVNGQTSYWTKVQFEYGW